MPSVKIGPSIGCRPLYEPGELILKYKDSDNSPSGSWLEEYGVSVIESFDLDPKLAGDQGGLVRLKLPPQLDVTDAVTLLNEDARVEFAEPNYRIYLEDPLPGEEPEQKPPSTDPSKPNDLDYRLWGLENKGQTRGKPGADIQVRKAWESTVGDRKNGPIVAIIDSGVDVTHPDLIDNLWTNPGEIPGDGIDNDGNGVVDDVYGYNAFHDNNDLTDGKVHGTHVAGTVGATGNNGFGITGVAQKARLMPIRIFARTGHTNQATVLRALNYADKMGARITANSWGGISSLAMQQAYAQSPALHIASAGNSGRDNDLQPHFPGSYPIDNMIAVAATDHKDQLGSFSCYGKTTVHLGAPGQDIYSTLPGGRYKSFSGTSMACPHVAGVASLILTKFPEATNSEVKARLLNATVPLEELKDKTVSGGRLNAALALEDDVKAPGRFTLLEAGATASQVRLQWIEPGDDGDEGTARRVEIRQSSELLHEANFKQAALLEDYVPDGDSRQRGTRVDIRLERQPRTFFFGLMATDNVGLESPLETIEVNIPPAKVAFEDGSDVDWGIEGPWAKVYVPGQGMVWQDSPNGDYAYGQKNPLTSPVVSLQGGQDSTLNFKSKLALGRGDFLRIQVKTDTQPWRNLALLQGEEDWAEQSVSLARYDGENVQVRFLFVSDDATNADGVSLKDIEILTAPATDKISPLKHFANTKQSRI